MNGNHWAEWQQVSTDAKPSSLSWLELHSINTLHTHLCFGSVRSVVRIPFSVHLYALVFLWGFLKNIQSSLRGCVENSE
jgi:hypothetical protein